MFVYRFIYPTGIFPRYFLRQAFFARRGRLPMRSGVSFSEISENRGILKITVDWDEAGTIHVPYLHKRYGLTFFATETLRPRSRPLHLIRELARGQLSRVLKRLYDWPSRGLRVPVYLLDAVQEGITRMTELAVMDTDAPDFDARALAVFESLVYLSHLLLDQFIEQSLVARKTQADIFPIFLGFRSKRTQRLNNFSEEHPEFRDIFQAWNPALTWRDIEPEEGVFCWDKLDQVADKARERRWNVFLGPIVRWDRNSLPHWILKRLDDPYSVRKSLFRYAETLIHRYPATDQWIVASGVASELDSILVSKRIEWADSLARIIRSVNRSAKTLIGIERPWGDSLRYSTEIPPQEIGERLAQNRFVDGFFLAMNFGLSPEATLPRDAFELNWLLDGWSQLGKPIYVSFSIPSYPAFDVPQWETPNAIELPWTLKTQQETVHRFFLSFLTRKSIQGIFWNQIDDMPIQKVPPAILAEAKEETKTFLQMAGQNDGSADGFPSANASDSDLLTPPGAVFLSTMPVEPENDGGELPAQAAFPLSDHENSEADASSADSCNGAEVSAPKSVSDTKTPPPLPGETVSSADGLKPPEISVLEDEPGTFEFLFPHSGLLTADGKAKPAFKKLAALQRAYM